MLFHVVKSIQMHRCERSLRKALNSVIFSVNATIHY